MATANLSSLPKEILLVIFNLSDSQQDVRHLSKVCRRLRDVYSSGGRRLLERVVKNQDSGWLDMVLGMGFMYRVSPSVHAYWFAYLKFDYDTLTPRLHRRTIRDLLYGKHGDKFESALHDFLNQFDNVHSKCGDILSADACRVLELGARYQRDLFKALKMKPSSLAESTMLVALALRCLAISLDLGRFVIKGENVPEHGHFVVHKGGLTSGAAQGMAVWPKIEYSTDPTDFLPEDRQIQLFKGDKRDDYSTMMLYLVQMISMQIRENNPPLFTTFSEAGSKGLTIRQSSGDPMAKELRTVFRTLVEGYSDNIKSSPLEFDWDHERFRSLVESELSTSYAVELHGIWLGCEGPDVWGRDPRDHEDLETRIQKFMDFTAPAFYAPDIAFNIWF